MAAHSSILAWKTPWTEEPGGLQSMGSQRVRHDCSDLALSGLQNFVCILHIQHISIQTGHIASTQLESVENSYSI